MERPQKMINDRFEYIDFLRTVAIIVIIITHVLSFHLYNRLIFFIWNYLHFVVVGLVFSSGYVLTFKYRNYFNSFGKTISWYGKRLVRLLLPFYYYLLAHYLLWFFLPNYFSGLGLKKSADFIIRSLLLTGGVDFNWFALLFVQLTILFPLVILSLRKKILNISLIFLSLAATIYFTLFGFRVENYRYVMWTSWMSIIYLSIYLNLKEQKDLNTDSTIKRFLLMGSVAFISFFLLTKFIIAPGKDLVLTQHKYPPDAIYLTYGIVGMCLMMVAARSKVLYTGFLRRIYQFISQRTYQLFFIHYLALDITFKTTGKFQFWSHPATQTILVILISFGVTLFIYLFETLLGKKTKIWTIILIFLTLAILWLVNKNSFVCLKEDKNPVAKSAVLEWLQKPAAVRFIGKHDRTYISWIEQSGKVQIRFYDHKNKIFSDIFTVDDLYPEYRIEAQDDHNAPSLLILPDGQLLVFYVVHDVNGAFFIKRSKNIEDISSWSERLSISDRDANTTYNYPQAKRLANGKIVLFYRRGVYYDSDEYFKISNDAGLTWGNPTKIIDFGREGIYAFIFARDNQIHLAWNKAVTKPAKKNVYYAYSPDGGTSWKKKEGTDLIIPIKEADADLVFDSADDPAYVWDIVADDKNNAFMVFAYRDDPDHEFRFASWSGESWVTTAVTNSSLLYDSGNFFSGGVVIDPNDVYKVYLSKKRSKLEIESWISDDRGKTWRRSESITEDSLFDNFRPQVVENYAKDLRLVWSSGVYEGLVNSQWSGFAKVNIQSDVTKRTIPSSKCGRK
ncbi:hypothetical protein A3C98_02970 [Candidatus Roizmanbacteria bacterium RIFCSPHIGHO2_02_FULL_37_15]|uniref:Acyltransferase 3 domain-containing protein n=1 Tax=Candidatus Roizmanbacteria bacterium RIFCSPLOWO2_01_FULL_37_16 TaxID=1802058 RepID=A0A1F7IIB4_9BACT|nr:MAG: hypothetical protein A2859_02395 [Candidatus Roizmanbacteria bacterium RIFCSPHIGHO2_01_FULL_37_16b]OGK22690.1 MAG: hypothetical protein A3C98_02970 [Candidatus Roizmanbacteria bacterium RIFCSPHIGHO2_02_FULL_37_15]OGK32612.1 MAG: hypothetical protein A3F57_03370 [Candidatus Roizmanbacteria bacterium RIFCSPHIGHO2_12_FULL_36_11]OGK43085.1 MAG: hypothetical protein A3B40_02385 [Candidatus Roizmanbacteria bacterium RIFCSPLOWO2_01_FULL_37_16]OGK55848.1 MAG: hypothetical protein A3I50_03020 [C